MKTVLKKGMIVYGGIFVILIILRLVYGYVTFNSSSEVSPLGLFNQRESGVLAGLNKASSRRMVEKGGAVQGKVSVEQKFEKVSIIRSESSDFDNESKKIRETIVSFNAVIQYENNSGLRGGRSLELTIGVEPNKFDQFVEKTSKIGKLTSITTDKIDKTSEYKDLKSKRKALEETIESLIALKKRGGRVEEYIQLENRILEVKKQIQDLGVKLGEYDSENELCTVKFSLYERAAFSYSFVRSLRISFEWAVKFYFIITISALMALLCLLIAVKIAEKLGLDRLIKRYSGIEKKKKA